jgi:hypothetical protein
MVLFLRLIVFIIGIDLLFSEHCAAVASAPHKQMQSYSQASQDQFVYSLLYELLDKQDEGYYLEIGAGHPSSGNNSYFFEKALGWKGVSLDINSSATQSWYSIRQNTLLIEDATLADYQSILKPFPQVIDYLSLDIDNNYDIVLQKIPFDEHIFKVITIEHDFYRFGDKYRQKEREILESLGYRLLCPDVSIYLSGMNYMFEDWWIHPSAFPPDLLAKLTSFDLKGKRHDQLISIIKELLP